MTARDRAGRVIEMDARVKLDADTLRTIRPKRGTVFDDDAGHGQHITLVGVVWDEDKSESVEYVDSRKLFVDTSEVNTVK